MRLAVAIVTAIAVIAMLVWWLLPAGGPPRPSPMTGESSNSRASESRALARQPVQPTTPPIRPLPFTESKPVEGEIASTTPSTILRGRCVSAGSRDPLAGCRVALHGWEANSERMEAYVARGGKVDWHDPGEHATKADGEFEFRFAAPPPYQFMLELRAPGCVAMMGRWFTLAAGEVADVGDVAMQKGTSVRGRVIDEAGSVQPKVLVYLDSGGRSKEKV